MALFAYLEALAQRKLRGAAYSLVGVVFILIGVAFLTALLWMVLVELRDARFAAQILGFGFVALGFILIGIGKLISRLRIAAVPPPMMAAGPRGPLLQLLEGFLVGLQAGRRSHRDRH